MQGMAEGKKKEAAQNIVNCLRGLSYSEAVLVLDIVGKSLGNYATVNAEADKREQLAERNNNENHIMGERMKGENEMEITITATPKEIAALFSEATKRQEEILDNEEFLQKFEMRFMQRFSNGLRDAVKRHHHQPPSSGTPAA